ncbi:hypothetical protein EYC80_003286 [Monilinia laxa]|uniref:Alcohol dehydrogenase-like N-terminal domain-containing protein n=1 Tax=Monilinia laxa TaxID=61186 RepID=A0A5N6KDF4_MONLA|nr:hypothetical protein EYC80_003286 [Monilinia laxa]
MSTHAAVVTAVVGGPLQLLRVPRIAPREGEVRVRVEWTASTPFDLHQNDGGLLVVHPQVWEDSVAGTVVEVGGVGGLGVGDWVFGFAWREQKEKAHQEFVTLPSFLLGKIPLGISPQQAVTLPNNFVTVFHAATTDLDLELPWPKPNGFAPRHKDTCILIMGRIFIRRSIRHSNSRILRLYQYRHHGI